MARKARFDESGDSDELQALFDSMAATAPAKPRLEVISESDGAGDSADLQVLFDSVAAEYTDSARAASVTRAGVRVDVTPGRGPAPAINGAAAVPVSAAATGVGAVELFQRLGQLTRSFHEALSELGYDRLIEDTAKAIPDARQRLSYVAQMTEQAASRVLNATDIARPIQEELQRDAEALGLRWEQVYANQLSVEGFKALAHDTRAFFKEAPGKTKATSAQLMEIMMAQDFQDLTGQVIKRLVETAQGLETQMLQLLVDFQPGERKGEAAGGLLNGPVIDATGRSDVVTSQQQVDDLLDSLGF